MYQEMANEIYPMWKQMAAKVIPIVISSTGVIPKSILQNLKRLKLHPNIYIYIYTTKTKSVIIDTCSNLRIV